MAGYDYDIGILGGGAAGLTVAAGSAQLGAKTLLIEKEKKLGGDCLHYGCVPSKTLIRSAGVYHLMKNAEKFGLPKVEIPPVDYKRVRERIKSVINTIQEHDSEERFCKLGAKVHFGHALFTDDHTVTSEGKRFTAKTWIIATGSSPMIPPVEGLQKTPFITNKEVFTLDRLPETMIILGGGPIGIEMAQAFARLGSKVTVIDMAEQILNKEDKDMADLVKEVLQKEGVTFHLKSSVVAVKDLGKEREVSVKKESSEIIKLKADTLFVALGRSPNVKDMGLDSLDIKYGRTGIEVDRKLRTGLKHIYAAGDVNGGFQFTHAAGYEGGVVISNAIFHLPRKVDYTHIPWCTYTEPELASIGMNEKMVKKKGYKYKVWTEEFKGNDRSLAEGEENGRIKMILSEKEKPLGVQIAGPHAGELIGEWVALMNGKVKLSTLAGAIHPYPTLTEINKRVTGAFFSEKIFSEKIKKGLKFFFNLKGRACGCEADM